MKRYLVVGASGTVGSGIVQSLIQQGAQVRAVSSRKKESDRSHGVEWVQVDLSTGKGLSQAFEGVHRAFFLSPPGYAQQDTILIPLIQEAKKRGLEKVVLMTAYGANAVESSPLRKAEVALEKSGLIYNIIRPNWFMQNFNTFWLKGIQTKQNILLPVGEAKVSFIDARDISDVAVHLLVSDAQNNQAFDLTGGESLNHDEVAQVISNAIGKKVGFQDVDPVVFREELIAAGLPKDYSDFMLVILGALRAGYSSAITSSIKDLLGREPRTLKNYAKDYSHFWK